MKPALAPAASKAKSAPVRVLRALGCGLLLAWIAPAQTPLLRMPPAQLPQAQTPAQALPNTPPPSAAPPEITIQSGPFRPQTILTTNTQVVPLAAVVRDSHSRIIDNLTRDDFEVLDRGVPQTLASFSIERHTPPPAAATDAAPSPLKVPATAAAAPAAPRTVALFLDDLDSSFTYGNLAHSRTVALEFLRAGLPPGEQVGVFTASGEHQIAFTTDTAALEQAVAALQPVNRISPMCTVRMSPGVIPTGTGLRPTKTPGIEIPYDYYAYLVVVQNDSAAALRIEMLCDPMAAGDGHGLLFREGRQRAQTYWDAVEAQSRGILASIDHTIALLAARPGDRVLLLSGSGFIADTLRDEQSRIEQDALHANVVINALDTDGPPQLLIVDQIDGAKYLPPAEFGGAAQQTAERAMMAEVTAVTGGTFYRDPRDLGPGMQGLAGFPAVIYLMSFSPAHLVADGKFHSIKVRLSSGHSANIETRAGYYAPAREDNPISADLTQRLNQAAMADTESAEIPATLAVSTAARAGAAPAKLRLAIAVDVRKLDWTSIAGRSFEQITFAAVLSHPDGVYATGERASMTFHLTGATRKQKEKTGITGDMAIPAVAGPYHLRVVVMESVHGKLTTFNRDLTVP